MFYLIPIFSLEYKAPRAYTIYNDAVRGVIMSFQLIFNAVLLPEASV